MAKKKEILIFTRNAPRTPKDVIKLPNYTIIKYLEDAIENCDYKYPPNNRICCRRPKNYRHRGIVLDRCVCLFR